MSIPPPLCRAFLSAFLNWRISSCIASTRSLIRLGCVLRLAERAEYVALALDEDSAALQPPSRASRLCDAQLS